MVRFFASTHLSSDGYESIRNFSRLHHLQSGLPVAPCPAPELSFMWLFCHKTGWYLLVDENFHVVVGKNHAAAAAGVWREVNHYWWLVWLPASHTSHTYFTATNWPITGKLANRRSKFNMLWDEQWAKIAGTSYLAGVQIAAMSYLAGISDSVARP